jgi:hypothetical protein
LQQIRRKFCDKLVAAGLEPERINALYMPVIYSLFLRRIHFGQGSSHCSSMIADVHQVQDLSPRLENVGWGLELDQLIMILSGF